MSFILDALKKSENERARQAGPVLLEARVTPPRRGFPAWAIAVTVVLVANLVVLGVVVLRRPVVVVPPTPGAATPAAPDPAATAPATTPGAPPPPAGTAAPAQPSPGPLPQPLPAAPPAPTPAEVAPAPGVIVMNPADYEPARPPSRAPASEPQPSASPPSDPVEDARLPSASDLQASGAQLPELRLALHVFDADPGRRYVLLNGQRLREGESTAEGIRVERITPTGMVLDWRNRRFRLQPGE